ncbi:MAG: hypothetical protein JXR10_10000 [Cyclobacteriaceae bacterium]
MKGIFKYYLIFLLATVSGCVEQVDYEMDQYVKVLGLEGAATAERLIPLANGDIMVLGEMGVAAHDIESTPIGPEIKELEDQAPMIAITDPNGNLKFLKMYPLEDFDLKFIDVFNFENRTIFKYIEPLSGGGYAVMAEVFGFDYSINIPGVIDTTDLSLPGSANFAPVLFRLDDQYNVTEVHSFNAGPDWNGQFTLTSGVLKALPNDEIGILLGRKILADNSIGYTFIHMDGNLDTIAIADNFDNPDGKLAYDFDIDDSEILKIFGTENDGGMYQYDLPLTNMSIEINKRFLVEDGVFSFPNTNEHFTRKLKSGEFLFVYTNPRDNLILAQYGGVAFRVGNQEEFPGTNRAPRAVYEMMNGDLLIYEIIIPANDSPFGYLHRVKINGTKVFSRRIDGNPGDVIETEDGKIIVAANNIYNGLNPRINLIKLDANGKLY